MLQVAYIAWTARPFAMQSDFFGADLDLPGRPRTNEEVKRLSQWLLRTQRISRVGGWAFKMQTGEAWISPEARRIYGIGDHEPVSVPYLQTFPLPHHRPRLDAALRDLMERQQPYDVEFQITRPTDGAVVDIHSLAEHDAAEGVVLGTIEDITERKRAEAERARLATAVEQAAETILITDLCGTILYANPAFEKITGYTRAEAVGQNPRLLKSGRHDNAFYRRMWETLGRGEVWTGRFINRRKDGGLYEEDATISPVRDAAGRMVNYVAVKRDVTRETQLEDHLRQMQKMDAIGRLAGGVAHDFNNILLALLMQTELLEGNEPLPAGVREGLRQIRQDANRAAELTRQLLLFGRRQTPHPRRLDLNEVVTHLARMLQRILGEDVRLQLRLHGAPLFIHADPGMMEQVLLNLAVNARDAMGRGGRLLIETAEVNLDEPQASLIPEAAPGPYVTFSVSDTGAGIAPEVLPRIFEPFFTTKETGKGTGLGLATVFGIVKQHQGWITVDTQPGQGATFRVCLPACPAGMAKPAAAPASLPARGGTETLLLVEDDLAVRTPLRLVLERHGYRVLEAANGGEALELWSEQRATVALLLTDLVMPGAVGGQELARRLQAEQPRLRVVYISGYSVAMTSRELRLNPGEKFIQKPFNPDDLLKIIRESLGG